jgi:amidase
MEFSEYLQHDATALAALVARGEVSPAELLDIALAQNERVHGRVNAVCRLLTPQAQAQLDRPLAGPLAGVPFLVKDAAAQDYAGVPTTFGSRAMRACIPAEHSAVVRRYLGAGLVVFGKTNLPEFALKAVTDPALYGRATNPWNLGHTPGGPSGGAAAAVAAGIVPMAAGNDGGGSIASRPPAAACSACGLRAGGCRPCPRSAKSGSAPRARACCRAACATRRWRSTSSPAPSRATRSTSPRPPRPTPS